MASDGDDKDDESEEETSDLPLILAVEKGDAEMVRSLLSHGANVHERSILTDQTALLAATRNQFIPEEICEKIVRMLLATGACIDDRDHFKYTPLMNASLYGLSKVAAVLLDHGANPNDHVDDNSSIKIGDFALDKAIYHEHIEIVKQLVERGANTKGRLVYALESWNKRKISEKHLEIVKLLLSHGGAHDDDDKTSLMYAVETMDRAGRTPELVKLLLLENDDANPEVVSNQENGL